MTDDAELWLRQNDPDYASSSQAWKHVDGGEVRTPPQEVPWGGDAQLDWTLNHGGRPVEPVETRACEHCDEPFIPVTRWHRFCSERCRNIVQCRRYRATGHSQHE